MWRTLADARTRGASRSARSTARAPARSTSRVKLEYLYATFPGTATTYTIIANGNPIAATERDVQIVRAGLNWHF